MTNGEQGEERIEKGKPETSLATAATGGYLVAGKLYAVFTKYKLNLPETVISVEPFGGGHLEVREEN